MNKDFFLVTYILNDLLDDLAMLNPGHIPKYEQMRRELTKILDKHENQ